MESMLEAGLAQGDGWQKNRTLRKVGSKIFFALALPQARQALAA
ncbi:hypothetical protein AAKU55_003424 [Oxalobacteraceae bacterium GrIS 1.11]